MFANPLFNRLQVTNLTGDLWPALIINYLEKRLVSSNFNICLQNIKDRHYLQKTRNDFLIRNICLIIIIKAQDCGLGKI